MKETKSAFRKWVEKLPHADQKREREIAQKNWAKILRYLEQDDAN